MQPFIALGLALRARGQPVRILAPADYAGLVTAYGLPFAPLIGAISELMDPALALEALDSARSRLPLGFAQRFVSQVSALLPRLAADALAGCADAELIVASTLGCYVGRSIAEHLGLPLVPVHFHPFGATWEQPDISFPAVPNGVPLRGLYYRLSHSLAAHGLSQLLHAPLNTARRQVLGLPRLSRLGAWRAVRHPPPLALYAYSALLAPRPRDWPGYHRITGPWLLDQPSDWVPPPELAAFLADGPPPVYVGFGSILAGRDPVGVAQIVAEALAQAGMRGLLYRGAWGDLDGFALPDHLLRIGDTPHDWLFPQLAAVVTHGGAGTVVSALRAGAPPVVLPVFGDQRLWARRVAELGAGPPP
ncbi:MAG: glycosyltransferase family 1 protein, partial [Oscillochloris sp.]|nr:glycosyltransferase family 1 protein [Oscillochloris sp.]